mmetsp:Transcript_3489/g.5410  ORF Transcript_3489/g.5410 Transcript_3489/m.5410 type:complete len:81 (+) Transcript_3489:180-422(+)
MTASANKFSTAVNQVYKSFPTFLHSPIITMMFCGMVGEIRWDRGCKVRRVKSAESSADPEEQKKGPKSHRRNSCVWNGID